MLAGQLLSIAEDMIADYDRLEVIPTLQRAVGIAANRPNLSDSQYRGEASQLHALAERMLETTILKSYPIELRRYLSHSGYSQSLPDAIARMIIVGFGNRRKEAGMSSAELNMHLAEAQQFYQKMLNLVEASESFGVKAYAAPDGLAALEVRIPDLVYARSLNALPSKIEHVDDVLSVIEELVSGSRTEHKLLWASTSDLVVAISLDWAVIVGALLCYERLLVVAEKHLNILKLVRDLRKASGGRHEEIARDLNKTIEVALEEAVKEVVRKLGKDRDKPRLNELENELKTVSNALLPDLSTGMRFGLDPRDQQRALLNADDGAAADEMNKQLEARREMEMKLDVQVSSFADEDIKLLTAGGAEPVDELPKAR